MMKSIGLVIILFIVTTGCSPFGRYSVIDIYNDNSALGDNTKADLVSGGTQTVGSNPGVPSQNYKASVSVGQIYSQNTGSTGSGYKVTTSIQFASE